jgi:acyl carrier protein
LLVAVTPDTVLDVVRAAVARVMECDAAGISRDSLLGELGVDSLARVELAEVVESELSAEIPGLHLGDDELLGMTTVGDAVDRVLARLSADAGS